MLYTLLHPRAILGFWRHQAPDELTSLCAYFVCKQDVQRKGEAAGNILTQTALVFEKGLAGEYKECNDSQRPDIDSICVRTIRLITRSEKAEYFWCRESRCAYLSP